MKIGNCYHCEHFDRAELYCTVCSTKPPITGDPRNCPYYNNR